MLIQDLIKKSPIRILEKSTCGGVGKGNLGVIAARKGVGKTACLVHIALDRLMQNRHVIHVSFSDDAEHIIAWYEEIFNEIANRYGLSDAMEIHDEIIKNRIIMNFVQNGIHITEIEKSIVLLIQKGKFSADTMVIDGYNFEMSSSEEIKQFKSFAEDLGLEIWFTASLSDNQPLHDKKRVPFELAGVMDDFSAAIFLQPVGDFIHLTLLKGHNVNLLEGPNLKLDPKILLIAEETEKGTASGE